jgi:Ca2+-binding RTX toxin-like protein
MAYIYNNTNIIDDVVGEYWATPTSGPYVNGVAATGPITVAASGMIRVRSGNGSTALELIVGPFDLTVHGTIASYFTGGDPNLNEAVGIAFTSNGQSTVRVGNTGFIFGSWVGIYSVTGLNLNNAGNIGGGQFGIRMSTSGIGNITNTGRIDGNVQLGSGNDTFTNTGFTSGSIDLWDGNDTFIGGSFADKVRDNGGLDSYNLGDGIDYFIAVEGVVSDLSTDTVNGGANTGSNPVSGVYGDIYDASLATSSVYINADSVSHNASQDAGLPGVIAAGRASGNEVGTDNISNFEVIIGGAGNDVIFGGTTANELRGGSGNDGIHGGAGDDLLIGEDGNDRLFGDAGNDVASFTGEIAQYVVTYSAATLTYTFYGYDGFIDTVTGVENFRFADGMRTAAILPLSAAAPIRSASVVATTAVVNEGNSGTTPISFSVLLSAAAYSTQTLSWSVAGTGVNAADAADFSNVLTGTLTFAAGETYKTLSLNVVGDTITEANESFTVSLSAPSAGLSLGVSSAVATINNDDGPNTIDGDAGANNLIGTAGIDQLNGLAGNDFLDGGAGADVLLGGAGDDRIIYDAADLAANVNGGADSDTLVVIGGSLPTGFNLVASAFEQAVWQQTDNAGQSWSTIFGRYNSNWQITSSSTILDNGVDREMLYDYTASISWQSRQLDYTAPAAGGALSYDYLIFDDLSSRDTSYDTDPATAYKSIRNDYDAAGLRTYLYFVFEDNSGRDTTIDTSSTGTGSIWQSLRNDYDAVGQKTYTYYVFDNGTQRDVSLDYTAGVAWKSLLQNYDATPAHALTDQFFIFDNNTSRYVEYGTFTGQPGATQHVTNYADAAGTIYVDDFYV